MERQETDNVVAYTFDDGTGIIITPVTQIAGLLAVSQISTDLEAQLDEAWTDSGLTKLIFFVDADNEDYRRLAKALGFKQEGRLKNATPTGDLLIFGQYR